MYSEFMDRNRESWKFTYKGRDLEEAARKKVTFYSKRVADFRAKMSVLLADKSVAVNGRKIDKIKSILQDAAAKEEQCQVFAHEFSRTPDREFTLSMADVVFFGLAGHDIAVDDGEDA